MVINVGDVVKIKAYPSFCHGLTGSVLRVEEDDSFFTHLVHIPQASVQDLWFYEHELELVPTTEVE